MANEPDLQQLNSNLLNETRLWYLSRNYKYIDDLARQAHSPKISLRRTALESLCPPRDPPPCTPASERYRTHDGTCNNKRRPRWGSSQMPFNRFLPPVYGDGVDSIRNSVEGGPLSSSRFVSLLVHGAKDGEAPLTLMIAQWGQLLDHDMTATAQPRSINGSVPSCCGGSDFHPSCFPIKVPLDDPWLAPLKVRCLEFLRSAPAQRRDCILSWREQTNQATSFIDASPIYANSAKLSDNGRIFRKGLLIYGRGDPAQDVCLRGAIATQCIRAGDGRSGEQPGLLALHHVWVGEHNRIALELGELNPHWSDEKIYQETRRIVGAMFQHITYREFLPLVLGKEVCRLFDLELLNVGYYDGYDPKTNPSVANAFAAAAFRFGHSLVQNSYMRCDRHHNIISNNVSLHEEFQRGDIGSVGSLHRLLRGMATQRALKRDEFITPELTNHLFQTPGFPFGLDLAAINIQRGRDHGIPPYTAWRGPCGLTQLNTWDDFENVVGPESAQRIRHAYRSVHDIDLFVGGIAERPVVGGLVGPTFACIIAQQFSNSRKGDRFWYENGRFESAFTPAQLHALRHVSLAQVLCRSVGGGTFQPHIFIPADFPGNERLPCGEGPLAPIDLSAWLEQDPFVTPSQTPLHVPQSNFVSQNPDRVFEIVSGDLGHSNQLTTVHVIKEDKVGFQNRIRPVNNVTTIVSSKLPQVDLIPNASIGLHRPQNPTKINDKLDIKRKDTTTRRPAQSHLLTGVSNKLDSKTRVNINIKSVNRHRIHTTTRRTVIVNNIPIEFRNVENSTETISTIDDKLDNEADTETSRTSTISTTSTTPQSTTKRKKNKKRKTRPKNTKPLSARLDKETDDVLPRPTTIQDILVFHDDNFEFLNNTTVGTKDIFDVFDNNTDKTVAIAENTNFGVTIEKANSSQEIPANQDIDFNEETNINDDNQTIEERNQLDDNDINPLLTTVPMEDNKRVQRQITKTKNTTKLIGSRSTTKIRPVTVLQNFDVTHKNLTFITLSTTSRTVPEIFLSHNTTTLKATNSSTARSKLKKPTTQPNVELRHYQTRQAYNRPQKVILKGPNSDAYEIEINIRQTSVGPQSRPLTANSNYAEYTNMYKPYNTFDRYSPNYMNYIPSTTPDYAYYQSPSPTGPPSYGHVQRPTRPPTVIYLNENDRYERTTTRNPNIFHHFLNFATNGLRPTPISGINAGQKERPANAFLSNTHNYNGQYGLAAQTPLPPGASSHSQTDGVHATSSAVSTGDFGTIFGVASANGADSTFSFNIRPKPSISSGYDPSSPQRPIFNQAVPPEYVNLPISTATTNPYHEAPYEGQVHSPFSTHKRPISHGPFTRNQNPITGESISSDIDKDYDYSSRAFLLEPLSNVSSSLNDNKDYLYDDGDNNSDNSTETAKKYDQDGYLRPEHMIKQLLRVRNNAPTTDKPSSSTTTTTTTTFKNDNLDDNFVLPMISNITFGLIEIPSPIPPSKDLVLNLTMGLTDLPDTNAKNLNNDIQAESDDTEETTEPFLVSKNSALSSTQKQPTNIAFAPIKVLTKPERPDNWVIFDTPTNQPPLPEPPEVEIDVLSINEVPKPLMNQSGPWLNKSNQQSSTREKGPLNTETTPD